MIGKGQGHYQVDAVPSYMETNSQTLTKKHSHTFNLLPLEAEKLISPLFWPKVFL